MIELFPSDRASLDEYIRGRQFISFPALNKVSKQLHIIGFRSYQITGFGRCIQTAVGAGGLCVMLSLTPSSGNLPLAPIHS